MTRSDNSEVVSQLFDKLRQEFGNLAPHIINVIVRIIDGRRLTFPDIQDLYREERNLRIRNEFNGGNYDELAILYRLKVRQVRRIIHQGGKNVIHRVD